jgi:hypothetical protein
VVYLRLMSIHRDLLDAEKAVLRYGFAAELIVKMW